MKRLKRLAVKSFGLVRLVGLVLSLVALQGCAGYTFTPNGSGIPDWGGSTFQPRQQAQQYNCESRPVYGAFGEFLRTDTVCR